MTNAMLKIRNLFLMVKKELVDLLNSNIVLAILFTFFGILSIGIYHVYVVAHISYIQPTIDLYHDTLYGLLFTLVNYGSLVSIVIGFSSMSLEKRDNSLKTLVTKPVYRDMIINSKLIGCLLFILSVFVLSAIIYFAEKSLLFGDVFGSFTYQIFIDLSIVIFISLLVAAFFLSVAFLLSILIQDDIFALFGSVLVWIISMQLVSSASFSQSMAWFFGTDSAGRNYIGDFIVSLGPDVLAMSIMNYYNDLLYGLFNSAGIVKLGFFVVVMVILSYIAFSRSDIS